MDCSSMELKVASCRDLKAFNFLQRLSVYAVVSVIKDEPNKPQQKLDHKQRQKIPISRDGDDGYREWNHTIHFDLNTIPLSDHHTHPYLLFELRIGSGILFLNRNIGEVRVPFRDLIDEFNGSLRFVSYQIRTTDGKPNGVLNFSYKVNGMLKKDETYLKRENLYPSLEDVLSPLPKINVPSFSPYHLSLQLTPTAVHGLYNHSYNPSPFVHTQVPYLNRFESSGYGNGWWVNSGFGQEGEVNGSSCMVEPEKERGSYPYLWSNSSGC